MGRGRGRGSSRGGMNKGGMNDDEDFYDDDMGVSDSSFRSHDFGQGSLWKFLFFFQRVPLLLATLPGG